MRNFSWKKKSESELTEMSVTTMELLLVRKSFQSVSQYRFLFEISKSSTSGEDFVSGFSQSEEVTFS